MKFKDIVKDSLLWLEFEPMEKTYKNFKDSMKYHMEIYGGKESVQEQWSH